jgi:hypothetical protein
VTHVQNNPPARVAPDGPPATRTGQSLPSADVVPAAPEPLVVRRVPRGGFQCTVDENNDGGSKMFTCSQLPPEFYRVAKGAQSTAFGLLGLFGAIIILGPFARMLARRIERRAEMAPSPDAVALRQQIEQLQQSVDAMSVEMERIGEAQRFQSKLLYENRPEKAGHIA